MFDRTRRSQPGPDGVLSRLHTKWVAVAVGLAVLAALGVGPVIWHQHSEATARGAKAQAASDALRLQSIAAAGRIHDRAVIAAHEAAIAAHDDAVAAHLSAVKVFATLDAADAAAVKDSATIKTWVTATAYTISDEVAIQTRDAADATAQSSYATLWNSGAPQKAANAAYDAEYANYTKWRAPAVANLHRVRTAAISAGRLAAEGAFALATTTWDAADAAFRAGAVAVAPVTRQTATAPPVNPCVASTKAAIAANAASPTGRALARANAAEATAARKYGDTAAAARNNASPTGIAVSKAQAANDASPTGVALRATRDALSTDNVWQVSMSAEDANAASPTWYAAENAGWVYEGSPTGANGIALNLAQGNNTPSPTGSRALLAADAAFASPAGIAVWIDAALNDASPTGVAASKAWAVNYASPAGVAYAALNRRYRAVEVVTRPAYTTTDARGGTWHYPATTTIPYTDRSHAIDKAVVANDASPTWAAVMKASCRSV